MVCGFSFYLSSFVVVILIFVIFFFLFVSGSPFLLVSCGGSVAITPSLLGLGVRRSGSLDYPGRDPSQGRLVKLRARPGVSRVHMLFAL